MLALIGIGYTITSIVLELVWSEPSAYMLIPICAMTTACCMVAGRFLRTERTTYLVAALGLLVLVIVLAVAFELRFGCRR